MRPQKKNFTIEEIIKIVTTLGSQEPQKDSSNNLIFQTVCHNHNSGSYKLYYYTDSNMFHCYTHCGDSFNIYELVARNKGYTLPQDFGIVVEHINSILGIGNQLTGFRNKRKRTIDEYDLFNRYLNRNQSLNNPQLTYYPKDLINFYSKIYPVEWLNEGITSKAMDKFNIRFDIAHNKIIIPHYDKNNNLIGIRGRALNPEDIALGQKYMPVTIEKTTYKYPTAYNLYGLNFTYKAIQKHKKAIIFEAEKSVLKCESIYGDNNFAVACCGSNISNYQRDLILNLGIKEVFIAMDKEYHEIDTNESDNYSERILTLCNKFTPYVTTYVLWDIDSLLDYKDSPCDQGQEVLEILMKNKYEVQTEENE